MDETTALDTFRMEIRQAGLRFGKVESLVAAGWTLPMVREAADIATVHKAKFGYIARMEQRGIPLTAIGELMEFKREYPELTLPR